MLDTKTPTFTIYKPGSSKEQVDTLEHCFIERKIMNHTDLPANICAKNGEVYRAVYPDKIPFPSDFEVIISFQKHSYGKFAIIRVTKANNGQ